MLYRLKTGSYAGKETGGRHINAKRSKLADRTIESDVDLAAQDPGKWEEVQSAQAAPRPARQAQHVEDDAEPESAAGLPENFEDMTVEELREFAADEGISLHSASTKKDIQKAIRDAVEG